MSGCQIGNSRRLGPGVAGRTNDDDPIHDSMEGSNGNRILKIVGRRLAGGERQHVHSIVDGCVERGNHVSVEAAPLGMGGRGPAHLVGGHPSAGRAALGSPGAVAVHARSRNKAAAGGR
ncbi:hypothetical protein ACLOJK_015406 [Asimina triloba]